MMFLALFEKSQIRVKQVFNLVAQTIYIRIKKLLKNGLWISSKGFTKNDFLRRKQV